MYSSIKPVNMLSDTSMELKCPRGSWTFFEKTVSRCPESMLEWRSRSIRRDKFLNSNGIDEWKPLFDKLRNERLVMFPIQVGNFPVNALLDKSSVDIDDDEDNQLGS